jgi:two-component system KDP operon response regulator KdpE
MENRYKVLVIEDEKNIANFIKADLEANDYQVITAYTAEEGEMFFHSHCPDLILLDLGLSDKDGLSVITDIRKDSLVPILVVSARIGETDKVEALDRGANDYITKPFSSAELQARIRASLRVNHQNMQRVEFREKFTLDGLIIDYDQRLVSVNGREIKFTPTEYNIIALLSEHAGHIMTYSEIIKAIWNWNDEGSIKKLQVNMANIRKKLGTTVGQKQYIINELGVGYRIAKSA